MSVARPVLARLEDELDTELTLAMMGDPWGPALSGRLKTMARMILLRHGLAKAQVQVVREGEGVRVVVALPPGPQTVRELVVSIGAR